MKANIVLLMCLTPLWCAITAALVSRAWYWGKLTAIRRAMAAGETEGGVYGTRSENG